MDKRRIDLLLVERGIVPSREKAQRLLLAGEVLVNDQPVTKAGALVKTDSEIRLRNPMDHYVSRGAYKLLGALDAFQVDCTGKQGLDIGASTGGFTQVLLERGAVSVVALDVGTNQLDWKIRNDPRVRVLEKTNARHLGYADFGQFFDVIVVDVSFISLDKILPTARVLLNPTSGSLITLIKPQFEVGPENVGKGGIVTDENARNAAVERIRSFGEGIGLSFVQLINSPITGTDGNVEYLAHWKVRSP